MTLSEILADVVRGVGALLEALLQLFGELWGAVAGSIHDADVPILPILSSSQRDALVTVALVVGGTVAVFLLVEIGLLLVRRATSRRSV